MADKYYFINNYSSNRQLTDRQLELNFYREQKAYKSMVKDRFYSTTTSSLGGLKLLILFPLILSLISILQGTPRIPTFTSLLQGLSNFEVIPTLDFLNLTGINLGDWSINISLGEVLGTNGLQTVEYTLISFNWLRDFFRHFLGVFDIVVFIANGLINIINFLLFFLKWIFIS